MSDLPVDAVTAAAKNITAFLIGCGWTIAEAAEVAPELADNVVAAVAAGLRAQGAAAERARILQLLLGSLVPVFYDNGYPIRAVPQAAVLDLIGGAP